MPVRVGLISDTHMPERWPELPGAVQEHFAGVDLILHAGDVGELWVLDQLSLLGPVIAVHGNDETDEATAALAYEQLIGLAGQRVLLCHSHESDRTAELASRKSDDWEPKLRRCVAQAKRHGASIYVYGHTHIPMTQRIDGVLLVNPGAIASGNAICRQTVQTIAILEVATSGEVTIEHSRVDGSPDPRIPAVNCTRGFGRALSQVSESIASHQVELAYQRARSEGIVVERKLQDVVLRVARKCWSRELDLMDVDTLLCEAEADGTLGAELKARFRTILCGTNRCSG